MQNKIQKLAALAVVLAVPGIASAIPLYDDFGPFTNATWGGTGIPNSSVAVSRQIEDGVNTITIAMNATARYSNPVVTDNGDGTFFATTGSNTGGAGESPDTGALWNFNTYIDVTGPGGVKLTDYDITLFYDFNPAFDNGPAGLGQINITNYLLGTAPLATNAQDSQNLLFAFLGVPVAGVVTPPGGAFNPNAIGEYNFAIQVTRAGWNVEQVRMDVQVVPIPAAVWLFGSALGLVGVMRRRAAA